MYLNLFPNFLALPNTMPYCTGQTMLFFMFLDPSVTLCLRCFFEAAITVIGVANDETSKDVGVVVIMPCQRPNHVR